MCGRYSLATPPDQLAAHFGAPLPPEWQPNPNAAPSQHLPVLLADVGFTLMQWGYTPSWAKTRLINARAETLTEKPTFRAAFQSQRCLVPADAFYEWQTLPDGSKQPMRFALRDGASFAFWRTVAARARRAARLRDHHDGGECADRAAASPNGGHLAA